MYMPESLFVVVVIYLQDVVPPELWYVPGEHCVHADAPPVLKLPGGQVRGQMLVACASL